MQARMLPSKPKACPLCTTKSLKSGFSPVDIQRSAIVHPPSPFTTATRRMPLGLTIADQYVAVLG